MSKPFTDNFVRNLKPTGKQTNYSDPGCRGLYLRVTPSGVKTWAMIFRSKITGKLENKTIGHYPAIPLGGIDGARTKVNDAWKLVEQNKPVEFSEVKKNGGLSVDDALALYQQRKLDGIKSGGNIAAALAAVVRSEKWGRLPFTSLGNEQIMDALYHMRDVRKRPAMAGKLQQMLSTWCKWATIHKMLPHNPIAGMPRVSGDVIRERILSDSEIRKLWAACQSPEDFGLHENYATALMLILTTTARPGMICGLRHDELFGFAHHDAPERRGAGPLADFAAARMKMARAFVLPLNPLALDVIKRKHNSGGVYICPSAAHQFKHRGGHVDGNRLSAITGALSKRLGFKEDFHPHDLRRTGSALLCREFPEEQVSVLLAHDGKRGVMKHYNPERRWNALALKREMSDKLAVILSEIISSAQAQRAA